MPRKTRAKPKQEVDVDAPKTKRAPDIQWAKNPDWTHTLVSYLGDHVAFRLKLFSDSTADATKEGRTKHMAKDGKNLQYGVLAKHIFASEPGQSALYLQNPGRYGTAVETRLRRLKSEYITHLKVLGSTGAGLDPSTVTKGSTIANVIAGIRSEWPWWDDLHAYWRELPNYNPQGVQSSEPGTMHASNAAALFIAADEDEPEEILYDIGGPGGGDEQDVDGWDSRGGSPVDEGDPDTIQWDVTPPPSHAPDKKPAILFSPVQPQFATSPSPPPHTQARHAAPTHPIGKRGVATRHGKPTLVKKTAVDRFNDSRQEESRRLNFKRKMEHDERMASINLKRYKYDLRYGSTPQTPAPSTPLLGTVAATDSATKEDKQIEILRLQIRLAELTQDNSTHAHASSSQMPYALSSHASSSRMPHNPLEEVSTPSSGMSSNLSYVSGRSHNGFVDNNFMASEDPSSYHVPDGEASSVGVDGVDMTNWPETFNYAA